MDRLRLIETFVRVADAGSFSAVAREERTTQSAISKQVQALEAHLGARLLARSTRRHALTEAGQLFYERCVQMLDTLEEARLEVHRAEHEVSGMLRVAAPVAFGRLHIVPRLAAFYAGHPKIRVNLQLDDGFVDLVAAGADLAFRIGELKDSRLIARRIGTAHRALLASPAYLARHGEPRHPQDLMQAPHRCVHYFVASGKHGPFEFQRGEERLSLVPPGALAVNDSNAYWDACVAGLGIGQLPEPVLHAPGLASSLVPVLTDWEVGTMPVHVVFPSNRHLSTRVQAFVEWAANVFGSRTG